MEDGGMSYVDILNVDTFYISNNHVNITFDLITLKTGKLSRSQLFQNSNFCLKTQILSLATIVVSLDVIDSFFSKYPSLSKHGLFVSCSFKQKWWCHEKSSKLKTVGQVYYFETIIAPTCAGKCFVRISNFIIQYIKKSCT